MSAEMLRLPQRGPGKALLGMLTDAEGAVFSSQLLDEIWDASERGELPNPIAKVLRDWIAHAHFQNDPVTQERRAQVQAMQEGGSG